MMGGKRYFCDYCDRTLPHSLEARKKHNFGLQHRAVKQEYYSRLKSAKERYNEELEKKRCKKFSIGQICAFGDQCIFSHTPDAQLEIMRHEADLELKQETIPSQLLNGGEPFIDNIKTILKAKSNPALKRVEETLKHYNEPRPHFDSYYPLPPSLQPLQTEDLLDVKFNSWG